MRKIWLTLLMWPLIALPIIAQRTTGISTNISAAPASAASPVVQVTLGNATVPLTGPWKFHIGDNMTWAQPEFEDSAWGTMDLTPPPGSDDPTIGSSGFVPGWTTRGYKGYSGYAWYRLRINIQDGQSALALKMPDDFDDAYQIYVNGQLIGEFGRFTAHGVTLYNALPRSFPLPANFHSHETARAIAEAAKNFGQEDDISVLSVRRLVAGKAVLA